MQGVGSEDIGQGTLTTHLVGRLSAALWMGSGVLVVLAGLALDFHAGASRAGMVGVGLACIAIGAVVYRIPWTR